MSISILPDEILFTIWSYCDIESLKESALVCANWNYLISKSAVTMKRFQLKLDPLKMLLNTKGFQSGRLHHDVKISDFLEFDDITNHFDLSKVQVLSVTGTRGYQVDCEKFTALLSRMPLLKYLHCRNVLIYFSEGQINVLRLKLKRVEIGITISKLLRFFKPKYILELRVNKETSQLSDVSLKAQRDNLTAFLTRAKNLTHLDLNLGWEIMNDFFKEKKSFRFQLKSFRTTKLIDKSFVVSVEIVENFNFFLLQQKSSLQVLQFDKLPAYCVRTIFNELTTLKTLQLSLYDLPKSFQFYQETKQTKSIASLTLTRDFPNDDAAEGLFSLCPNLENLSLTNNLSSKHMGYVEKYNKKLKSLKLNSISNRVSSEWRFENLESLYVDSIGNSNYFISFVILSPAIKTLEVKYIYGLGFPVVIAGIIHHTSLKHLKLSGHIKNVPAVFEKLKSNYGKLETLEINVKLLSGNEIMQSCVKFDFPKEKAQWQVRDREKKFEDCCVNLERRVKIKETIAK